MALISILAHDERSSKMVIDFLTGKCTDESMEKIIRYAHDANATKFGAISCEADGLVYAAWLEEHRKEIDGVIMCLPNFSDESGAVKALRNWKKPILIQAYPRNLRKA